VTLRNGVSLGITIDSAHERVPPTIGSDVSSHSALALGKPFFYLLLQSARALDALDLGV
jgi:hypothetical protein